MKQKITTSIVPKMIVLAFVFSAFALFYTLNYDQVISRNREYVQDSTAQTAESLNYMIENSLADIQVTASVVEMTIASSDELSTLDLQELSTVTDYDYLAFTDSRGRIITGGHYLLDETGEPATAIYESYYKQGMAGFSGVTLVSSRLRPECDSYIMYYTPLWYDGNIVGVLSGVYANTSLTDALTSYFYDDQTPTYLCKSNGTVIVESAPSGYEVNNVSEIFDAEFSEEVCEEAMAAVASGETFTRDYKANGNVGVVSVSGLDTNGWVIVRAFPSYIVSPIVNRTTSIGALLIVLLCVIFLAYLVFELWQGRKTRRMLERENEQSTLIIDASTTLFDRFAVCDLRDETYEYRKYGVYEVDLPRAGTIDQMRQYIIDHAVLDEDKIKIAELCSIEHLRNAFTDGTNSFTFEYLLQLKDEQRFTQVSIVCVRRDANGAAMQVLVIVQDVDDLRRQEEQNRAALLEATHTAELASQAKGNFLSRMSHDIRTPLNTIMGLVAISSMNINRPEKLRECFQKMMVTSSHLLSLLNDILDLSKIDSNKLVLSEKDTNLEETITQVQVLAESQAHAKGLELTFDITQIKHKNVVADAVRLRQILTNLVDNAVKYTSEGSVLVRVSEQASHKKGWGLYTFVVRDTGCGIDAEFLPHLFEPFTREEETATKAKGSGLGMAILKSLVTMMNGTVTVDSKVGEGTTFTVRLAFELSCANASEGEMFSADEPMEVALGQLQRRDYSGRRVLLVDDNEMGGSVTQYLIESTNIECERAMDGLEAYNMVVDHPVGYYDIVFMDLQMPVMNGYDSARKIRAEADVLPGGAEPARPDLGRLPIVALSADAFTDDALRCYEAGMNNHISKPLKIADLLKIFEEYL